VQQLDEYLDDDAQMKLAQARNEAKAKNSKSGTSTGNDSSLGGDNDSMGGSMGGGAPSRGPSFSGSPISDFGDDELADIDIPEDGSEAPAEAPEEPEAVESVTKEGNPITSSTLIQTTLDDLVSECEIIKGTLNAREDTKGVNRLQVKEDELWIYYNDDVNLNDTMVEVIGVLNSTGYTYLKFNRLARSNNAIVFDICLNTDEDIKTIL